MLVGKSADYMSCDAIGIVSKHDRCLYLIPKSTIVYNLKRYADKVVFFTKHGAIDRRGSHDYVQGTGVRMIKTFIGSKNMDMITLDMKTWMSLEGKVDGFYEIK